MRGQPLPPPCSHDGRGLDSERCIHDKNRLTVSDATSASEAMTDSKMCAGRLLAMIKLAASDATIASERCTGGTCANIIISTSRKERNSLLLPRACCAHCRTHPAGEIHGESSGASPSHIQNCNYCLTPSKIAYTEASWNEVRYGPNAAASRAPSVPFAKPGCTHSQPWQAKYLIYL